MSCGKCDSCELERIGCGCDGALDDGCFLCAPAKHPRPPCPSPPRRRPRSDDCPRCHKSMWMGRNHADGCQCTMPATIHTHPFSGDVQITYPTKRPGYSNRLVTRKADVQVTMDRRVDLYHFILGLRFHLRAAEAALAKLDGDLASPEAQRRDKHFQGDR